ncbi:MAG: HK97 gp10 family phage protein [Hydrogenophaga sp.]|nr:HK97 gp10 family phage protein [Hydrogenophaga sp.]
MLTHNADQVAISLEAHGAQMEREVWAEAARLAQEAARRMRERAPKWHTVLANSITVTMSAPNTWEIRPGVDYAIYREKGQPAGKHLPRFFDPAAKPIVDWLASKAFAGMRRVTKKSRAFMNRELELRDRYMGLSWHVFHKGLKATPFVEPVAREMDVEVPRRLDAVVQRLVAQANGSAA